MPPKLTDIQLWDAQRAAQISLPESLFDIASNRFSETLGGVSQVKLTIPAQSKLATATDSDNYHLSQGKILRFIYDDGSIWEWRIKQGAREFSGQTDRTVTAEPIIQDLTAVTVRKTYSNGHVRASAAFYQQTFTDIMSNLLSEEYNCPSYFTLGNVPAVFDETVYDININAAYFMVAIKELAAYAEGEWDVSYNSTTDKYEINFYERGQLGGGKSQAPDRKLSIKPGDGNRLTLQRRDETAKYFSRVVPISGTGNTVHTIGHARWDVKSVTYGNPNSIIDLSDSAIAKNGYGTITGKDVYFGNKSGEGWFKVLSTAAPNRVAVEGDASALTFGYFKTSPLANPPATADLDDIVFIEDPQAVAEIGKLEEQYARTDIGPYANLVESAGISPALSQWNGGEPVGWNPITGNETITRETNDLFVTYSAYAAKVQANKGGGLETISITINPVNISPYFSLTAYTQVASGEVRVVVEHSNGKTYPRSERLGTAPIKAQYRYQPASESCRTGQ